MPPRVIVIGAGMGGLAAASELAARGFSVQVLERASTPGGKLREVTVAERPIDSGPTVFTMRWVFDGLFQAAGAELDRAVALKPATVLARHGWRSSGAFDLFSDLEESVDSIGRFSGTNDAAAYRTFCRQTQRIFHELKDTYIAASRPSTLGLISRVGPHRIGALLALRSFTTMWSMLRRTFRDPRLRQLFGRYATYCGSSPFQTPATLLLVAHVEREGVWLVEGGMHRLAAAVADLARTNGATFTYGQHVAELLVSKGRCVGVRTADGEMHHADAVISNGDVNALACGSFGEAARSAERPVPRRARSLSAVTWSMVARTSGFPLSHHNVFFSDDYENEFDELYARRRLPSDPTTYVCAQDRAGDEGSDPGDRERLFVLINAPADGDQPAALAAQMSAAEAATFRLLEGCGLVVDRESAASVRTTPADFERLFPATGGALYGRNLHGMQGSFAKPGSRSRVPGLYLAGGSVHPGAGVPMATLSGRQAAAAVIDDLSAEL